MVILIVEIDDLHLFPVDPEREPPVPGDRQAPGALAVAGQPVRLPTRDHPQFLLPFHVLEEGDDSPKFRRDGRLYTGGIVVLDEPAQSLVDHVTDLRVRCYPGRVYSIKLHFPALCRSANTASSPPPEAVAASRVGRVAVSGGAWRSRSAGGGG